MHFLTPSAAMQRVTRRASSVGSNRRSSVSARDIQAIQAALQKQRTISNQLLTVLVLLLPFFSLFYFYTIFVYKGSVVETFSARLLKVPFLFNLIPPLWDTVAWRATVILILVQVILHWVLPPDKVTVLSTSIGDHVKLVNGFSNFLLVILLYPLGAALRFYRPDLLYLHFPGMVGCLCALAVGTLAFLYISYRFGEQNTIDSISEFFFGVEMYPMVAGDIDLKHFLRTRITLVVWALYICSALCYQKHTTGYFGRAALCCALSQFVYICKCIWNEDLMLNALDSRRSKCGFYRIWADLVFFPLLYCTPMSIVVQHRSNISLPACIVLTLVSVVATYAVAAIDRQRYHFRINKGLVKINGRDPFFIQAKYRTETGDASANLLLGSGYWASVRHPNYICEIIIFFCFCGFQGFKPFICYFPWVFLVGYLFARSLNDENRCLLKYGQYWIQHCLKVPFRWIPGVY